MNKSALLALLLLGTITFLGLGVLLYEALPNIMRGEITVFVMVLVISVEAALFVFGVFVGFLYGRAVQTRSVTAELRSRFLGALQFERQERIRLERSLYDAKQLVVGLRDRLSQNELRASTAAQGPSAEETERMRQEMAQLAEQQAKLHEDLVRRKERIADLMTELSVAQSEAELAKQEAQELKKSISSIPPPPALLAGVDGESIREILKGVAKLEGIRMALVADDHGLVVEAVGDDLPSETVAAISNLVERLGPQVRDILPLGEVSTVSLGDEQGLVLETRYFPLFGVRCALAIARDEKHPYPGLAKQVIASITAAMAG